MTTLKVAVLMNDFATPHTRIVRHSFESAISSAASSINDFATPKIDFCDPIVAQAHPAPNGYDLIILSGRTADPVGSDPWALRLQTYLRTTVSDHPKQEIVGICRGHQTTFISFGGSVGIMGGPEIGVDGKLRMHEFHCRYVKRPGKGFVPLVEENRSLVNEANTIITFQGHPELNAELAKKLVERRPAYMGLDEEQKEAMIVSAGLQHDGVKILERILRWVQE